MIVPRLTLVRSVAATGLGLPSNRTGHFFVGNIVIARFINGGLRVVCWVLRELSEMSS